MDVERLRGEAERIAAQQEKHLDAAKRFDAAKREREQKIEGLLRALAAGDEGALDEILSERAEIEREEIRAAAARLAARDFTAALRQIESEVARIEGERAEEEQRAAFARWGGEQVIARAVTDQLGAELSRFHPQSFSPEELERYVEELGERAMLYAHAGLAQATEDARANGGDVPIFTEDEVWAIAREQLRRYGVETEYTAESDPTAIFDREAHHSTARSWAEHG